MFDRPKLALPKGATETFEVRYSKGKKPFPTRKAADDFARAERAEGRWVAIDQVLRTEVEKRR